METPNTNANGLMKACGLLLLVGAPLLMGGFLVHPEESASSNEYQQTVASHEGAARTSHWLILAGLLAIACAGPLGAMAGLKLGKNPGQILGPAIAAVGALAALPVVAIEATVVPSAAIAGDAASFNVWSELASAFFPGFLVLVAGLAVTAFSEARTQAGSLRIVSYAAGGLACAAIVGCLGAYYAGIWALYPLSYGLLGVFAWLGVGSAMELFGHGHGQMEGRAAGH